MICQRCKKEYKQTDNTKESCKYHSSLYVCRPHPVDHYAYEINDEMLFELKDWKAKFWDCCGEEDESAEGCVKDFHIGY